MGNFGEVFHAVLHQSTDVAIKRLFIPYQRQTEETFQSFMEEVRFNLVSFVRLAKCLVFQVQLLGRLSHPNIVQFMGESVAVSVSTSV